MFINLRNYAGYEVRYNLEADCLEVRRLHQVEVVTDESDDGLRSGGHIVTRLEGVGEWRAMEAEYDEEKELLAEGREKAAALRAEEERRAQAAADYEARPVLTVQVKDGQLFIDGESIDVDRLIREAVRETEMPVVRLEFPGYRLVESVDEWLGEPWESPRVSAFESRKGGGVVVAFGCDG